MKPLVQPRFALLACALTLGALGCSSKKTDALEKQLASLQNEVNRLRSTSLAMQDRFDALDERAMKDNADSAADGPADRPVLEVVRLTPEEPGEPAVVIAPPADDGPRPVIQGDQSGVEQFADDKAAADAQAAKQRPVPRWKGGGR